MKSFKLIILLLSVHSFGVFKTTHAVQHLEKNNTTDIKSKEIIDSNKGISVETVFNLDKPLGQLNITGNSNTPRIRKVSNVDNGSLERKLKDERISVENTRVGTTTTAVPLKAAIISEAGAVVNVNIAPKNTAIDKKTNVTSVKSDETLKNVAIDETKQEKKASNSTIATITKASSENSTTTTTNQFALANHTLSAANSTTDASSNAISKINSPTAGTTASSSTTTTTTTTTTPKPKKPTVTFSVPDFPDLEKDNPELQHLLQTTSVDDKLPSPDGPHAQPSKEFNDSFHRGRDFILPIVSMIFIIPLVIGIIITSYRRFRDCWSTRHYRRMDFLVDGMYND